MVERLLEAVGERAAGEAAPEGAGGASGAKVMERKEVTNARRLQTAASIIFGQLDGVAVAAGEELQRAQDAAVGEMEVGPFQRIDGDGRIAEGEDVVDPGAGTAAGADRDCLG